MSQNGISVAHFSGRFNIAQMQYIVTAKELLVIVETINKTRSIFLGQIIMVWTNHEHFIYENTVFSSDRILQQRLIIEEFGPKNISYPVKIIR